MTQATASADHVTYLRQQAKAAHIHPDAMEAAILFKRHDAPSLSDLQLHNLAVIISRKLQKAEDDACEAARDNSLLECPRCGGSRER
jgi:hypothetical protein